MFRAAALRLDHRIRTAIPSLPSRPPLPPRHDLPRRKHRSNGISLEEQGPAAAMPAARKPSRAGSGRSQPRSPRLRQEKKTPLHLHRSKTHITWARVHARTQQDEREGQNDDDDDDERRLLVRRLRGMHLQWGYLRHQCSGEEELVAQRRRFSSWKTKFHNVVAGRGTMPYAWSARGRWLFDLEGGVPAMRRAWEQLDPAARRDAWPLVMLSTLHSCPAKADAVLAATLDPLPPGYALLDVLTFTARRLPRLADCPGPEFRQRRRRAEQVLDLAGRIVQFTPPGHLPTGQRAFGLLAQKLPADLASELLAALGRAGHALHPHTRLHFARRLAGDVAHKAQALEVLESLAREGVDLTAPAPHSAVTALLHCRPDHPGWTPDAAAAFSPRAALERLMAAGFAPNHVSATALLDSLCHHEASPGAVDEAIRLALLLAESGVPLDTKAWATVARGAKRSLDPALVARSFDVARAAHAPYRAVLTSALHAVYFFADHESRLRGAKPPWVLPLFEPMLALYAQRFDLEPLQHWLPDSLPLLIARPAEFDERFEASSSSSPWRFLRSIVPAVNAFFAQSNAAPRARPSPTTIALMLRAYIRSLRQPYDLLAFWAFFKSRPAAAAFLLPDQGSLVHDTLIMTMLERPGLARPALQVFGAMLRDHESHPRPSLCTYSILVRGLAARGDRLLADQVVRVMQEHGVAPDLVAWNTLVKGYAAVQDVGRTVSALQDMEAAGFKPDLFTFKAFGRLKNQAKALEMMEDIIHRNSQSLAQDDWVAP